MRIGVISHSQKLGDQPQRYVSKNAAKCLVRRLLAVMITKQVIQMVEVREMAKALPAQIQSQKAESVAYEHHIEPKLERFGHMDTEWLLYLNGYTPISE